MLTQINYRCQPGIIDALKHYRNKIIDIAGVTTNTLTHRAYPNGRIRTNARSYIILQERNIGKAIQVNLKCVGGSVVLVDALVGNYPEPSLAILQKVSDNVVTDG